MSAAGAAALARERPERADEDLRSAEHLLTMPRRCPHRIVCFHAQQAVEKAVQALLVSRSVDFPGTHDIGELVRLLPAGLTVPLSAEERERLTGYATASRYPGDWEPVEPAAAGEAVATARRVAAHVRSALQHDAAVP